MERSSTVFGGPPKQQLKNNHPKTHTATSGSPQPKQNRHNTRRRFFDGNGDVRISAPYVASNQQASIQPLASDCLRPPALPPGTAVVVGTRACCTNLTRCMSFTPWTSGDSSGRRDRPLTLAAACAEQPAARPRALQQSGPISGSAASVPAHQRQGLAPRPLALRHALRARAAAQVP